jgi:hypothetical protein
VCVYVCDDFLLRKKRRKEIFEYLCVSFLNIQLEGKKEKEGGKEECVCVCACVPLE